MTAPIASARGLQKNFGGRQVLHDVHLELPTNSAFGLVGPNGAGKTTFIKILLGIAQPTSGEVRLMGQAPHHPTSRRKVGYLPERLALPEEWTPIDHLRSIARIKRTRAQPEALLEKVGLDRTAFKRRMRGFSKGMKQRVALAVALIGEPRLLILDEPTDGIDPVGRIQIRELLLEYLKGGATLFLNSHLLAETERLCDRVAILDHGRLLASGTIEDLKSKGIPEARFAPHPELETITSRHGFKALSSPDSERRAFIINGDPSPQAMSKALVGALSDGLVLIELGEASSDLEDVLQQVLHQESPKIDR